MGPLPRLACAAVVLFMASGARAGDDPSPGPRVTSHAVTVTLEPERGTIAGTDIMTVGRGGGGDLLLILREGLAVDGLRVDGAPVERVTRDATSSGPGLVRWRVHVAAGDAPCRVDFAWSGTIRETVRKADDLAFVVGDHSRGTVSPEGVFLTDATGWLPLDGSMATFSVTATVPSGWSVCTQGGVPTSEGDSERTTFRFPAARPAAGRWLPAGMWKGERRTTADGVSIGTLLSEENAGLSSMLMDAVEGYLAAYRPVLGPYPHPKFDIVENFFTTGYGMPSATLLGGDVLAHIGRTAARSGGKVPPGYLDHELVHCWWGNGVFVDYDSGNWCEALTTYCSNYLRKEWESPEEAAKHRRGVRARFAARVAPSRDYPLRKFTGKTEDFENDIGYGKGSMLFHAVRREIGDDAFFGALRTFAASFAGKRASWTDLRSAFEAAGKRRLDDLFAAMLDRTGAPLYRLVDWTVTPDGDGWNVRGAVTLDGAPWPASLPVVIETARGREERVVTMRGNRTDVAVRVSDLPLRVLLDPDAHAWRGFAPGEIPATLDASVHDPAGLVCVTPRADPKAEGRPWSAVAEAVRSRPGTTVLDDRSPEAPATGDAAETLPVDRSLLLVGPREENGILNGFTSWMERTGLLRRTRTGFAVHGQTFDGDDVSVLLSFRHPASPEHFVTVYTAAKDEAASGARRLFFYGGEGTVVFKGGRPVARFEAEGDASSRVSLLPALLGDAVSADRIDALVAGLSIMEGRRAGTAHGNESIDFLATTLEEEDGLAVVQQPVEFTLTDWAGPEAAPCAEPLGASCIPFCFSPVGSDWSAVPAEAPLRVDADTTAEAFLTALQRRLESRDGPVVVAGPVEPPAALADYLLHPSALPEGERARLAERAAAGGDGDPLLAVAGRRARLRMPDFPVAFPVIYFATEPTRSAVPGRLRSPLTATTVKTRNLFAVLPGTDPALAGEGILLSAHHDHLGPGFQGADDNASGVAAVREAVRALIPRKGQLGRPVVIALFGAEEWGLRGATAFAAAPPEGLPPIVAALNLDTVGARGQENPAVVGRTVYPGLAAVADRCLEAAGFPTGRDLDRYAFAWGSDHYALHAAGIPSIDWFAGDYRSMHSTADTAESVDAKKVARIARAAAAWALALSRGEVPR